MKKLTYMRVEKHPFSPNWRAIYIDANGRERCKPVTERVALKIARSFPKHWEK